MESYLTVDSFASAIRRRVAILQSLFPAITALTGKATYMGGAAGSTLLAVPRSRQTNDSGHFTANAALNANVWSWNGS